MEPVEFRDEMSKIRRALGWSVLLLALLGLAGGLLFYFVGRPLFTVIAVVAGVASVLFLLLSVFLWLYYQRRPESREKRSLRGQLRRLQRDLAGAKASLADAIGESGRVRDQAKEHRNRESAARTGSLQGLGRRIEAAKASMEQELAAALAALQKEHVDTGLRAMTLDPVHVPGVGDAMAAKLHERGIRTAYDVDEATIRQMEGFGESKTLSLVRWRESVAYAAQDGQPEALPDEQRMEIEARAKAQIAALEAERDRAQGELDQALERLRAREAQDLAAASAREMAARQRLAALEPEVQAAETLVEQYRRIKFSGMAVWALSRGAAGWKKRLGPWLVWILFLVLGLANIGLMALTLFLLLRQAGAAG